MTFFSALYSLLIGPLELFFEIIFYFANRVLNHPGLSIIMLSLAMNFLVLPLYRRADALQAEERDTEERLGRWTKHIKKTFSGDERFMILQTYYRQNGYKPTYALKGSVSLLLEIPFFIAAYNFLSHLQLLEGAAFGPIRNLGAPDAMFVVAGFTVNVLPILMTVINLVSSAIYTKGLSTRSKVQLYVMAALFLVLLYDSPAGLVFYWTLNNLFSLAKNIFYRLKNPRRALCVLACLAGLTLVGCSVYFQPGSAFEGWASIRIWGLLLQLPLICYLVQKLIPAGKRSRLQLVSSGAFWAGCFLLAVLTGVLIPSSVMHSSPEEFINLTTLSDPLWYIMNSGLLAFGTFVVWFGVFYMLASPAGKNLMGLLVWIGSGAALADYLFFGKNYGTLSPNFSFVDQPVFEDVLLNLGVLAAAALVMGLIWKKKNALARPVMTIAALALVVMSAVNVRDIHNSLGGKLEQLTEQSKAEAQFTLSRTGKNVMVLMMDRAVSGYLPYILNEKPELAEKLAGFTYYPNTISYGSHTIFGSPGLYGGYEYIPTEMNKRDQEKLADKHDEALKVLPVLFDRAGLDVTVCNPSYAGYDWIPDVGIYEDYPEIHAFNTGDRYLENIDFNAELHDQIMNRNFFCYSLFKIAPVCVQPALYAEGTYGQLQRRLATAPDGVQGDSVQVMDGLSQAEGLRSTFLKNFNVLYKLPELTTVTDDPAGTFLMMSNDTPHEPMLLQEPEYLPVYKVDNREYDAAHSGRFDLDGVKLKMETENQVIHYHANMASIIQLVKWFDWMRAQGVYDNTRIIVVADHGYYLDKQMGSLPDIGDSTVDAMSFNPLLLVKDFNSREFTTDHTFMTNADTPNLALAGLVENPVNPFTGKPINSNPKQGVQHISTSNVWSTGDNTGNTFKPDGWVTVHDNIFDGANWEFISENINSWN